MGNGYLEIKRSRGRWRHMTQKGQSRDHVLGPCSVSKMAGDTNLVAMEHPRGCSINTKWGMTRPNGHVMSYVIDDVTWPWKIEVVTPICLVPKISKTVGDRRTLHSKEPWIENGPWQVEYLGARSFSMTSRICWSSYSELITLTRHFQKRWNCLEI